MSVKFSALEKVGSLAVVGATGLVGKELFSILNEHRIRIPKIKALGSAKSVGETIESFGGAIEVEELTSDSFKGVEVAFFSTPREVTRKYVPIAMESGCLVVDDSSVYRMHPDVPLIVPEINADELKGFDGRLIATPNCTTVPLALALKPLHDSFRVQRVVVSTYQSVSGAGRRAFDELSTQSISLLAGSSSEPEVFPHQIAFNCIPEIGALNEQGNTEEEEKVGKELQKIFGDDEIKVTTTAVRVPTFFVHGLSVNVELEKDFGDIESVRELLEQMPGVQVLDRTDAHIYPTNMECVGSDPVFVGRIRRDTTVASGLNLWVMGDNLRKGAALNALQILDQLYAFRVH